MAVSKPSRCVIDHSRFINNKGSRRGAFVYYRGCVMRKHILLSLIGPIQVLLFFRLAEEPVADGLDLVGIVEGVHVLAPFAVGGEYGA